MESPVSEWPHPFKFCLIIADKYLMKCGLLSLFVLLFTLGAGFAHAPTPPAATTPPATVTPYLHSDTKSIADPKLAGMIERMGSRPVNLDRFPRLTNVVSKTAALLQKLVIPEDGPEPIDFILL